MPGQFPISNSLSQFPISQFPNFPIFPISQFKFSAFFYGESFSHIYNIFIKNIVFRDDSLHKYEMRKRMYCACLKTWPCNHQKVARWMTQLLPSKNCQVKIAHITVSYHGRVNEWMNEWMNTLVMGMVK